MCVRTGSRRLLEYTYRLTVCSSPERETHDENLGWVRRFLPDSIDRHDTHSSNALRFQSACLSVCWNPYYKLSTFLYCSGHKVYKTELTPLFYALSFLLPLFSSLSTSALLRLRGMPLVEALHYKPEGRGFDSRWVTGIFHWLDLSGRTMTLESAQPLTEMSARNISWGVKVDGAYGLQPGHPHVPPVLKFWEYQPTRALTDCPGL